MQIALTPGEPAGVGPDLIVRLAQAAQPCELIVYADPQLLESRAHLLGLPLRLREPNGSPLRGGGELAIAPVALRAPATPKKADPRNAPYVLETLERALADTLAGLTSAMVTGPVNKAIINASGIAFSGHTEFLAAKTQTSQVVMMLASKRLRVALATTHLPLRAVPDAITQPLLVDILRILDSELREKFGIPRPRILVAGLNPHAGEGGYLGREELEVIAPAIDTICKSGIDAEGPLAADTLFTPFYLETADAVLAMYHDQGLPVLKYQGFGSAVNITLGLPIIRTSVDHGTAFDLAGTQLADTGSLMEAIRQGLIMAKAQDIP